MVGAPEGNRIVGAPEGQLIVARRFSAGRALKDNQVP